MKIYTIKTQLVALSLGLLTAASANANLITNGSFETHDAFNNGNWGYFNGSSGNAVSGWSSVGGPIEVGTAATYGVTGQDGNDVMELDSTVNVTVNQSLITSGSSYTLSFLYAARQGVAATSDTFDVQWNGSTVASFNPTSTTMMLYSILVTGTGNDTLSFVGTGTCDSYGALIDNVQLNLIPASTSVPEPSTWMAGMLLALPFGIHGLRALRMRQQRA